MSSTIDREVEDECDGQTHRCDEYPEKLLTSFEVTKRERERDRERGRDRERKTEREREKERERERKRV